MNENNRFPSFANGKRQERKNAARFDPSKSPGSRERTAIRSRRSSPPTPLQILRRRSCGFVGRGRLGVNLSGQQAQKKVFEATRTPRRGRDPHRQKQKNKTHDHHRRARKGVLHERRTRHPARHSRSLALAAAANRRLWFACSADVLAFLSLVLLERVSAGAVFASSLKRNPRASG